MYKVLAVSSGEPELLALHTAGSHPAAAKVLFDCNCAVVKPESPLTPEEAVIPEVVVFQKLLLMVPLLDPENPPTAPDVLLTAPEE
jgi:hypothetical protein